MVHQLSPSNSNVTYIACGHLVLYCTKIILTNDAYFSKLYYTTNFRSLHYVTLVSLPPHKFARPQCQYYWTQEIKKYISERCDLYRLVTFLSFFIKWGSQAEKYCSRPTGRLPTSVDYDLQNEFSARLQLLHTMHRCRRSCRYSKANR
jgi:hypothetical protein